MIYVECPPPCRARTAYSRGSCLACGRRFSRDHESYWVRVRFPDRTQRAERLGICSLEKALSAERSLKRRHDQSTPMAVWSDLTKQYCERLKIEGRNPGYVRGTLFRLELMGAHWGNDLPLVSLTPKMIDSFRLMLRTEGKKFSTKPPRSEPLSEATCDRYLAAGKAAWNTEARDIPNPFKEISLYLPDNEIGIALTPEQTIRLLDACRSVSQHLYEMTLVALGGTGLRENNIIPLRRDEVDFNSGEIHFIQKRKRPHTAILTPLVREVLSSIPNNGTLWFWISAKTGRPYHRDWRRPWYRARTLAGLPTLRFHDLRHTIGTWVYLQTQDLQAAQKILGHSQLSTTQRYAKAIPEYLRGVLDTLNSNLITKSVPNDDFSSGPPNGPLKVKDDNNYNYITLVSDDS